MGKNVAHTAHGRGEVIQVCLPCKCEGAAHSCRLCERSEAIQQKECIRLTFESCASLIYGEVIQVCLLCKCEGAALSCRHCERSEAIQ